MFAGMIATPLAGMLGVMAGWWVSMAIRRLPRGEPIFRSWPRCYACDGYLAGKDLVPVFSWLALRGKCRSCGAPLGYRYLLLELGTGLLFAVLTLRLGLSLALLAYLYLAAVCVALFIIDVRVHRLPDILTLPSYVVICVLLLLDAVATGNWSALLRAGVGMVVLFGAYYALAVVAAGALGFGDVKLAGLLGLLLGWSGWYALIVGGVLGFVYGGLFSLVLLVSRRVDGKTKIPFGPFMVLGALSAVLLGAHAEVVLPMLMT